MWVVTIQGEPPSEEIRIDGSVSEIRPLDGFVDTPNKLSSSQVGVVAWVALLTLVGVLPFFHRFMNYAAPQGCSARRAPRARPSGFEVPEDDVPFYIVSDRWPARTRSTPSRSSARTRRCGCCARSPSDPSRALLAGHHRSQSKTNWQTPYPPVASSGSYDGVSPRVGEPSEGREREPVRCWLGVYVPNRR